MPDQPLPTASNSEESQNNSLEITSAANPPQEVNVDDLLNEDSDDDVKNIKPAVPSTAASSSPSRSSRTLPHPSIPDTSPNRRLSQPRPPSHPNPNPNPNTTSQSQTPSQSPPTSPPQHSPAMVRSPDADEVYEEDAAMVRSVDTAMFFERRLLQSGRRALNAPLTSLRSPANTISRAPSTVLKSHNLTRLWSHLLSKSTSNTPDSLGAPTSTAIHTRVTAIGSARGFISLYDPFQKPIGVLGRGLSPQDLLANGGVVCIDLQFTSTMNYLISGHTSGRILLWDITTFSLLRTISDFSSFPVTELQFLSPKSQPSSLGKSSLQCQFLAVAKDGTVSVFTCSKGFFSWTHSSACLIQGKVGPILAAATLSPSLLNPLSHPSDDYQLIALASEQLTLFVALEPSVRILCKINRDPPELARPGALPSLSWRPPRASADNHLDKSSATPGQQLQIQQISDDAVERESQQLSHPLLALSRDKVVTLISVMPAHTKVVLPVNNNLAGPGISTTTSTMTKTSSSVSVGESGNSTGSISDENMKSKASSSTPAPITAVGAGGNNSNNNSNSNAATGPSSNGLTPLKFEKVGSLILPHEIVSINWLGGHVLLALDVTMQLSVIDPVLMTVMETIRLPPPNPNLPSGTANPSNAFVAIGHQLFFNAFTQRPETCYATTVRSSDSTTLLLGRAQAVQTHLLNWIERVNYLAETDWLGALALALDFYECRARGATCLPRTLAARKKVLSDQIADLIIQFMDTTLRRVVMLSPGLTSPTRSDNGNINGSGNRDDEGVFSPTTMSTLSLQQSIPENEHNAREDKQEDQNEREQNDVTEATTGTPGSNRSKSSRDSTSTNNARSASRLVLDVDWTPEGVCATCLDFCASVCRPDVVSGLIFPRFVKAGLQKEFVNVFVPYVLTGRITRIERNLTAGLLRYFLNISDTNILFSQLMNKSIANAVMRGNKPEAVSMLRILHPARTFKHFFTRPDIRRITELRKRIAMVTSSATSTPSSPTSSPSSSFTSSSPLRLSLSAGDVSETGINSSLTESLFTPQLHSLEQVFTRLDPSLGFDDLRFALRISRSLVLPAALFSIHARFFANYTEGLETMLRALLEADAYDHARRLESKKIDKVDKTEKPRSSTRGSRSSRAPSLSLGENMLSSRGDHSDEDSSSLYHLSQDEMDEEMEDEVDFPEDRDGESGDTNSQTPGSGTPTTPAMRGGSLLPASSPSISRSFGRSFAFSTASKAMLADRRLDAQSFLGMRESLRAMEEHDLVVLRLRTASFLVASLRGLSFPTLQPLPKRNCTYSLPLPAPSEAKVTIPVPSMAHAVAQVLSLLCTPSPSQEFIPDEYLHSIIDETLSQGVGVHVGTSVNSRKQRNARTAQKYAHPNAGGSASPFFYAVPSVGTYDTVGTGLGATESGVFVPGFSGAASGGVVSPYGQAAAALVNDDDYTESDDDETFPVSAAEAARLHRRTSSSVPTATTTTTTTTTTTATVATTTTTTASLKPSGTEELEPLSLGPSLASTLQSSTVNPLEGEYKYPFLRYALKIAPTEVMSALFDLVLQPHVSGWTAFADYDFYGETDPSLAKPVAVSIGKGGKNGKSDSMLSTSSGSMDSQSDSSIKTGSSGSHHSASTHSSQPFEGVNNTLSSGVDRLLSSVSPVSQVFDETTQSISTFFSSISSPFSKNAEEIDGVGSTIATTHTSTAISVTPAPHAAATTTTLASASSIVPTHASMLAKSGTPKPTRAAYSRHRAMKQFVRHCPTPTVLIRSIIEVFELDGTSTKSGNKGSMMPKTTRNATGTSTPSTPSFGSFSASSFHTGSPSSSGRDSHIPTRSAFSPLSTSGDSFNATSSDRLIARPWLAAEVEFVYSLACRAITQSLVNPEDLQPQFIRSLALSLCQLPVGGLSSLGANAQRVLDEQEQSVMMLLQSIPSLADSPGLLEAAEAKGFMRVTTLLYKQKGDFERVMQLYIEKIKAVDIQVLGKKSLCCTSVESYRVADNEDDDDVGEDEDKKSSSSFAISLAKVPVLSPPAQRFAAELFQYIMTVPLLTDAQISQLAMDIERQGREKERKLANNTGATTNTSGTAVSSNLGGVIGNATVTGVSTNVMLSSTSNAATSVGTPTNVAGTPSAITQQYGLTSFAARARIETLLRALPQLMVLSPVATAHVCLARISHLHDDVLTSLEKHPPLLFRYLSLIVQSHEKTSRYATPSSLTALTVSTGLTNTVATDAKPSSSSSPSSSSLDEETSLFMLNETPVMKHACSLLSPEQISLFDANQLPALLENSFTLFSSKLNEEFIRLLCVHSPEKVYPHIVAHHDHDIDTVLSLCRKYQILDACAYLLERTGDVKAALELTLAMSNQSFNALLRYVEENVEHYTLALKYMETAQHGTQTNSTIPPPGLVESAAKSLLDDPSSGFSLSGVPNEAAKLTIPHGSSSFLRSPGTLLSLLPEKEVRSVEHAISVSVSLCQRTTDADRLWFGVLDSILIYQQSLKKITSAALDSPMNSSAVVKSIRNDSLVKNTASYSAVDLPLISAVSHASSSSTLTPRTRDHLCKAVETVQRMMDATLFATTRRVLEAMTGHVSLSTILTKIVRDHKDDSLSEFRQTILTLLATCEHETRSLQSLHGLLLADKKALIRKKYRAQSTASLPRSERCFAPGCGLLLSQHVVSAASGSGENGGTGRSGVILFACGHAFHEPCFEMNAVTDTTYIPGDISVAQCFICIQMVSKANRKLKTSGTSSGVTSPPNYSAGARTRGVSLVTPGTGSGSMEGGEQMRSLARASKKQDMFYSLSKLQQASSGTSWEHFSRSLNGAGL